MPNQEQDPALLQEFVNKASKKCCNCRYFKMQNAPCADQELKQTTWGRKKNQRVLQAFGLVKQLPFQHLHSEDIRKLLVFKPVAIQYIFNIN